MEKLINQEIKELSINKKTKSHRGSEIKKLCKDSINTQCLCELIVWKF